MAQLFPGYSLPEFGGGLPQLPSLGNQFLQVPPTTGPTWPSPGGPQLGAPTRPPWWSGTGENLPLSPESIEGYVQQGLGSLFPSAGGWLGQSLLRLVFLILGILCVAGAIYLYRPTNEIIVQPAKKALTAMATES